MERERRGHYTVRLDVLAEPPYDDLDDALIIERYARCLERTIIEQPADWLWLQKKWKYAKPVADDAQKSVSRGRTGSRAVVGCAACFVLTYAVALAFHSAAVAR